MKNDELGTYGESLFNTWCAEAGLVANKSIQDKKGWDYLVQFTREIPGISKLDLAISEVSSIFQVKTTTKSKTDVYITLSNWNNLIQIAMPAFVFLLILDDKLGINSVIMTHIDREYAYEVLKKMRQTRKKLNSVKMKYKWNRADLIYEPYGQNIKSRILDVIKDSYSSYCKVKSESISTIGYSEYNYRGQFKISGSRKEIIDFSIGLKTEIETEELQIESGIRFDIPEKIESFPKAIMHISQMGEKIGVELESTLGMKAIFEGELLNPFVFFKELPRDEVKYRLKCDIGEFVFGGMGDIQAKLHIVLPKVDTKFQYLVNIAKAIIIFSSVEIGFVIRFIRSSSIEKPSITVSKKNVNNLSLGDSAVKASQLILLIANILNRNYIDLDFVISIMQIEKQRNSIYEYYNIIENSGKKSISITFNLNGIEIVDKPIEIPRLVLFTINDTSYILGAKYSGKPRLFKKEGSTCQYRSLYLVTILYQKISKNINDEDIKKEWEIIKMECGKNGEEIVYIENNA